MGLTTKIVLVVGIAAYLYRDKIFGAVDKLSDTGLPYLVSKDIGKAVQSPNVAPWLYKINWQGFKVKYENHQAWINDGSPEIVMLDNDVLEKIAEVTNAMIFEIGGYRQY